MATPALSRRFQLDVVRYELLDGGRRVRLERQPMELLILLAKRRGELATRDGIARHLWPKGVHVDADQSINRIVRKLRIALHDDPDAPQFIETVVGKGYRFVGPVEILDPGAAEQPEQVFRERALAATTPREEVSTPQDVEAGMRRTLARKRKIHGALATVATLLVAGVAWLMWTISRESLLQPVVTTLTSYPGDERFPTFAPDGNQIAFAWNGENRNNWDIYVKQVGSAGPPLRLTSNPADDTMPAWSPDGRYIAFERQQGTRFAVYLTSPIGGPERQLTDWLTTRSTVTFSPPSWSPDGQSLVAAALEPDAKTSHIALIPIGPGERRWLLSSAVSAGRYAYPTIARDGNALAYELCDANEVCNVNVIELGRDYIPKGQPRALTQDGHLARGLTWMPDGRALIYADGLRSRLHRIPLSGASSQRLELARTGAMFPAVSRQGDGLAFVQKAGDDFHLWRFAAGGAAAPEGFLRSTVMERAPHFSPDGKKIVFRSDRAGGGAQLWVANHDGSSPTPLTEPTGRAQGDPRWSPDGRWILYGEQRDDGHRDIFVIDAAGGSPRRITADAGHGNWSHDGRWIYFGSTQTGRFEIWRLPFALSSKAEQVTTTGGFAAFESQDGQTLFYTRTNALDGPVFARSMRTGSENQIIDSVYRWDFAPVYASIYYITRPEPQRRPIAFELRVFDCSSGRSVVLNQFESLDVVGLTVSPDRKTVVTSGIRTVAGDDLMLIQNFR
jgi:Tol biopolymer transport system component/DNA-binding winged helix-turn-helix (wHTH) protein